MSSLRDSLAPVILIFALLFSTTIGCAGVGTQQRSGQEVLTVAPNAVSFGTVSVSSSQQQIVTLTNSGTASVQLQSIVLDGSPAFVLMSTQLPKWLRPSESTQLSVKFTPTSQATFNGNLNVSSKSGVIVNVPLTGAGSSVATNMIVAVSPSSAVLQAGYSQEFVASVSGTTDTRVTWSVNGVQGGNSSLGSISSTGLFKAPSAVSSESTVTVSATSVADNAKSASANVNIKPAPTAVVVSVSPTAVSLLSGQFRQFTAAVSGTSNAGITWSVNDVEGGTPSYGEVSPDGLYVAPDCASVSTVKVTARSTYDSSAFADASVNISAGGTASSNRYVAENGSDSNDGSACHPWATIQHAANLATAGMTIHVGPGTYRISSRIVSSRSGTAQAPIRFVGSYDKVSRTWNTKVISSDTQVWSNGGQYVDIEGFDLTSTNLAANTGIKGQGAYSRYLNNYVHDIYSDAPGAGIMIGGGADYQAVIGNVIARIAHTPGGSTDNQGIYVQENYTTIVNNLVYGCAKIGIQIWSGVAGGKPQYNIVSGNTVFGCYRGFTIGAANSSYADHNTVTNNIFYGNTDLGMYTAIGYEGRVGPNNRIAYNNSYGNGTKDYFNLTHTNDIAGDPLFINYKKDGTGDYRLRQESPCRDKGTADGSPSYDFLGFPRPNGSGYEPGAFEYEP